MSSIVVHDKTFIPYISKEEIAAKIKELANQLNKDYEGKKTISNSSFKW
jgi:hypoxanthine phosphoribosyltransferase